MKAQKNSQAGFTLVEVAMVVAIGGLLMVTATTMLLNYMQQSKMATTQSRMQDIDSAIISYLNVNGALPCAASLKDAQDSATFGRQIIDTTAYPGNTDCYASAGTGTGTFPVGTGSKTAISPSAAPDGKIVIGAVPVRTLNLPDQDMADAWGDRFVFAVASTLTNTNPSVYDPNLGTIYVVDSTGAPVALPSGSAQYVIVSAGADRVGAYSLPGVMGIPCDTTTLEGLNCDHTQSSFRKTLLTSTQASASKFDDYVTFHTLISSTGTVPTGIVAPFQLATCPAGWGPYTTPDCSTALAQTDGSGHPLPKVCCKKQ